MSSPAVRMTVRFKTKLHKALRLKAADTGRSVSAIVCEAITEASGFEHGPDSIIELLQSLGYRTRFLEGVHTPTIFATHNR